MKKTIATILATMVIIASFFALFVTANAEAECAHENTELQSALEATCKKAGYTGDLVCIDCGEIIQTGEVIDALGHDFQYNDVKAPTCTENGWNAHSKCSRCYYSTKNIIPATGHKLVYNAPKAATCSEPGWVGHYTCENCDYTTYQEVPALEHSYKVVIVSEPTCTTIGYSEQQCTVCGEVEDDLNVLTATGHTDANGDGKCDDCGASLGTSTLSFFEKILAFFRSLFGIA